MATATVEDYIKTILLLELQQPGLRIGNSQVAAALMLTPGSTSAKVKSLAEKGLIDLVHRQGMRLTEEGRLLGMSMLRRHRLVETFLVDVLGLSWDEIHAEAEVLEHAISDHVLDAIDKVLNHPTQDPHGDPIPSKNGYLPKQTHIRLSHCPLNQPMRLSRVQDDSPDLLRHLQEISMTLGCEFKIVKYVSVLGVYHIECKGVAQKLALGDSACERMFAEVL